jgi:hypothetical protein
MVRRTETLERFLASNLSAQAQRIVDGFDDETIHRATAFLYTKETRASFAIEGERPSDDRTERFVQLARRAPTLKALNEAELTHLQNEIVSDRRFGDSGFRTETVYVGETISPDRQRVHFVAPRPQELTGLMKGWLECAARLDGSKLDPVVHAAVLSFGFVFLHPFTDGNGRLHRLLIHQVLARAGFTPDGLVFPVSAVMLRKRADYDSCLEAFSRPLMALLEYELDNEQRVQLAEDTSRPYRFFDATPMAEVLYGWIKDTLAQDFSAELNFVVEMRQLVADLRRIVDMPDRLLRLFMRITLHNGGRLSTTKRASHFQSLTDKEVAAMEKVVRRRLPALRPALELELE